MTFLIDIMLIKHKKSFRLGQVIALMIGFSVCAVFAQPNQALNSVGTPSVQPTVQPSTTGSTPSGRGVSRLAISVTQLGAFRCVERADQVVKFLGRGAGDIFIVDRPGSASNIDLITVTMLAKQDGDGYSTTEISLVPTPSGCTASYAATISSEQPCEQAERKLYNGLAFKQVESTTHRIATIGTEARVISRPVPGGCVLTKYEVVR